MCEWASAPRSPTLCVRRVTHAGAVPIEDHLVAKTPGRSRKRGLAVDGDATEKEQEQGKEKEKEKEKEPYRRRVRLSQDVGAAAGDAGTVAVACEDAATRSTPLASSNNTQLGPCGGTARPSAGDASAPLKSGRSRSAFFGLGGLGARGRAAVPPQLRIDGADGSTLPPARASVAGGEGASRAAPDVADAHPQRAVPGGAFSFLTRSAPRTSPLLNLAVGGSALGDVAVAAADSLNSVVGGGSGSGSGSACGDGEPDDGGEGNRRSSGCRTEDRGADARAGFGSVRGTRGDDGVAADGVPSTAAYAQGGDDGGQQRRGFQRSSSAGIAPSVDDGDARGTVGNDSGATPPVLHEQRDNDDAAVHAPASGPAREAVVCAADAEEEAAFCARVREECASGAGACGTYLEHCWVHFLGVPADRQRRLGVLVRAGGGVVLPQLFTRVCVATHVVTLTRTRERCGVCPILVRNGHVAVIARVFLRLMVQRSWRAPPQAVPSSRFADLACRLRPAKAVCRRHSICRRDVNTVCS